ncbi:bifunctional NAD(P)/FAD-dependent oxidoreductase/class I SAM-dependent methyltransferase [Nocardioides sp. Kera G14]|uniref:bifunctional NAD(P)/FAD-dependent oxidoreductase/class I SAM-dependent methyltransferase n=1 Tax=Nocardioides sp. Kera G14 TaxID=2884264 RepID=UPI001D12049C|nr:bifunctional NAD(P)/FAD-dependent oxidoreductase/class I SAM-dependent methyltransferase [Nocardioides sp. Kera G14]UDY24708.1 NAD(P)/FAD-dependent oxidoreductase [Nocardioides sp. Kera G14]
MSHAHDHSTAPQQHRSAERHVDVCVIGGSAAGLGAALQLSRQRRSVIVVDSGEPRNAPASHMHGYLGHEGLPPEELTALGREEVRSYGGEILSGVVTRVTQVDDGPFRVELEGDVSVVARRVLAATGLADELPDIEGIASHWGRDVIQCPFCHGHEVRDQRIVQVINHPMGLHAAQIFAHLTDRLTVVVPASVDVDPEKVDHFEGAGVSVVRAEARRIVDGPTGELQALELDNGESVAADVLVVGSRFRARVEPLKPLGLTAEPDPSGLGDALAVDELGQTTVQGVFAAGNITDPSHQVLHAAGHGTKVGAMIASDLAAEDLRTAARPSPGEADWDHRYSGDQIWSGHPNGSLVDEMSDVTPGRALDVGAGEGGDALWLARQGWTVTAADVSANALERTAAAAEQHGLDVACLHADANGRQPFPADEFDLVTAHYASIPRTPDRRAIRNILAAVTPGGTLLIVNHDLTDLEQDAPRPQAFDPDAYVRIEDFLDEMAEGWQVEVNEMRPRDHGTAASHHVNDLVLRARRALA